LKNLVALRAVLAQLTGIRILILVDGCVRIKACWGEISLRESLVIKRHCIVI
jgi:hypothetical protein